MNVRAGVNRTLEKVTGYRIVRAQAASRPGPQPAVERAAGPAAKPDAGKRAAMKPAGKRAAAKPAAERSAAEPAPAATSRVRQPGELPSDYDPEVGEIIDLVRDRTMTRHPKLESLIQAVRYVHRYEVPGAVLECGVWRGGSMLAVAHTLLRLGATDRDLYLFDTFTGMTPPTRRDVRLKQGKHADEFLHAEGPGPMAWTRPGAHVATLEDVKQGFAAVDYPRDRVHFVPGRVEDTVPEQAPDRIAVLRLDTDWYESTKHELTHLYERLSPGGVLIIDDYGTWQGSKEATDEFLDATGEPLLLTRVSRARVAVKPGLTSRVPGGGAGL